MLGGSYIQWDIIWSCLLLGNNSSQTFEHDEFHSVSTGNFCLFYGSSTRRNGDRITVAVGTFVSASDAFVINADSTIQVLTDHSNFANILELDLELELIQTHMAQKPMLRLEVGALGAHQVKNMRGRSG